MKYTALKSNHDGFETVSVLVVLVVLAVIGYAGYRLTVANKPLATPSQTTATTKAVVPAKITSKADLVQAANALDQDASNLNTQVDGNSLNGDISTLL